uniref:NADH-ubiquinone oxidoreductase chain 2 n=1 Tax=Sagmariasus verreauxi TaxID=1412110 RepID=U6C1C4_9EUCA|nr:NADH dehydrogenase subunit 2 [Sagmariasus verreauxi]BAO02879.1 NADH dehydrogenase subunit 2 [Sagmariasus verreauxi]
MFFSPQQILFFCLLLSGTFTAASATSWFTAWVGLELNLMAFIPLISSKSNRFSAEAALKYFLVQALGSAILVFTAPLSLASPLFLPAILVALLLKLGAAPFHFWFPPILEGLTWPQAVILMTLQKIAPFFLISHLLNNDLINQILILTAILSALVGAIGGLNQTSLRKILAFSSIAHISWMLVAISLSEYTWIIYFSFYTIISSSVAMLFNFQQAYHFTQLTTQNNPSVFTSLVNSFSLLSLGGLPPFSGFIPKWMLIEAMAKASLFLPLAFLIISALVTLYYYLRVSITSLILLTTKKKSACTPSSSSLTSPLLLSINLFFLLIPSTFALI